jgi:hypothetical protein
MALRGLTWSAYQWTGEWWRVRFGERPVCIWTGVLGCWATLSYPMFMMWMPESRQKYLYTLCEPLLPAFLADPVRMISFLLSANLYSHAVRTCTHVSELISLYEAAFVRRF